MFNEGGGGGPELGQGSAEMRGKSQEWFGHQVYYFIAVIIFIILYNCIGIVSLYSMLSYSSLNGSSEKFILILN